MGNPRTVRCGLVLAGALSACARGNGAARPEASRVADAGAATSALSGVAPADATAAMDAGAELARQASACLADLACPATEAERLLLAADDARDPEVDCFRLLDGGVTPRDPVRARACLERSAGSERCAGAPADLATAELATMRIDGTGGRADIAGARALVADCLDDVARAEVLRHALAKEQAPDAPPIDFCRDVGGTTLTNDVCKARRRDTADERLQLAAKVVFASLDDRGRALFDAAHRAHATYVTSMAYFGTTRHEAGSSRGAIALVLEARLLDARAGELAAFRTLGTSERSKEDVERASAAQAAAIARLRLVVPREKNAFRQTEIKWAAYRQAELALYEHVFGDGGDAAGVRRAVSAYLAERRAADVKP